MDNTGASATETTSYTYDNAGRKLTTTFANGSVETNTYSSTTKELTSVVHTTSGSSTIASYAYTYNSDGRKTSLTYADGSVVSYGYDAAGQLTSEGKVSSSSATLYSYAYTYDDAGNRLTKYDGTNTESYTYDDANKLLTAGTRTYYYDDSGNIGAIHDSATGENTHIQHDEERVWQVYQDTSGFSESFYYNGVNQRVADSNSADLFADDAIDSPILSDSYAIYNRGADNELVSEVRGSGSSSTTPIASASTKASKFYHTDGHGSTGAITDASGTTTDTLTTDAFGLKVTGSGSTPTPFGYAAQSNYRTDATGFMMLGYRYYDPSTGRFLSRDPAHSGYNWYTYCNNDPVNQVDPTGHIAWVLGIAAILAPEVVLPALAFTAVTLLLIYVIVAPLPTPPDQSTGGGGDTGDAGDVDTPQQPEAGQGDKLPPEKDPAKRRLRHQLIQDEKLDDNHDLNSDTLREVDENLEQRYKRPVRERGVGRGTDKW